MTRVAYVCADPGVPVFGTKGSSVHVQEIVRAWRRAGADVTVYCTRPAPTGRRPGRPRRRRGHAGIRRRAAARERAVEEAALALAGRGPPRRLRSGLRTLFAVQPGAVRAGPRAGRPVRPGGQCAADRGAAAVPPASGCQEGRDRAPPQRRHADVVACVSEPVVRWVRARVPAARTVLAPNGVNVEPDHGPRRRAGGSPDQLTVAFVGTLKPWHGVPGLLHGVALANAADRTRACAGRCHVIGDGPGRQDLERLAADLGVEADSPARCRPTPCPASWHECDAAAAPYPAGRPGPGRLLLAAEGLRVPGRRHARDRERRGPDPVHPGGRPHRVPGPARRSGRARRRPHPARRGPALRERLGLQARDDAVQHYSWDGVLSRITAALPPARRLARQ